MSNTAVSFLPLAAHSGDPLRLAMQRLWLGGRVLPAGARLTIQHIFRSEESKPLEVIYAFPLPRDAALRRFRISGDGFEVWSELKPTEEAAKVYEEGLAEGSLATLARQYGDGLINLTVGNVRPGETVTVQLELLAGVELRDDGYRFRFPFTLAPAYHSQARVSVADGEGEIELPPAFGDVILPRFRKDAASLHEVGFDLELIHSLPLSEVASPSHAVRIRNEAGERTRVSLAPERDVPDRDLVLDARFIEMQTQVLSGTRENGKRVFAAIIPSTQFGKDPQEPRRLAILLDRSGSMHGAPLEQARKAIEACLAVLGEQDAFTLIAFDDSVETLHPNLLDGTRTNRDKAREFLKDIDARGGTELAAGVTAAARALKTGGDILILTDGQVFGTEEILAKAQAAHVRLSCLGIGSASQDRFLALLARQTGGVSRFVTPRERVDLAAVDLFASIGRPVASGLQTPPGVQPEVPQAVFAGAPVLIFGETRLSSLELNWNGGRLNLAIDPGDPATGETVRLLQGSRLITDWESRYPPAEATASLERRKQNRVAARLAELSKEYGLASREMSLVAVVQRAGDRPGELPETHVVPVGMAQDVPFEAYASAPPMASIASMARVSPAFMLNFGSPLTEEAEHLPLMAASPKFAPAQQPEPEDELMNIAVQLEPDGGMPGRNTSERAARSASAILAFIAAGHTATAGAFRRHVARLIEFLRTADLKGAERTLADRTLAAASLGTAPPGDWIRAIAAADWTQLAGALQP